jgi:Transposase, Mutator family
MRQQTLTYYAFPEEHWRRIRTNNPLERILREIGWADARGRRFRGWAIRPEPRRGQAAPHRRHSVVDQTIPEHRTAEGPAMRGPEIAPGVRRTLERRIGRWRALTRTGDLVQRASGGTSRARPRKRAGQARQVSSADPRRHLLRQQGPGRDQRAVRAHGHALRASLAADHSQSAILAEPTRNATIRRSTCQPATSTMFAQRTPFGIKDWDVPRKRSS